MKALGDSHNFGRRVTQADDGRIHKPRSLVWEWLFLSVESPLRIAIDGAATYEKLASPFLCWPSLQFEPEARGLLAGGHVECLTWLPMDDQTGITKEDAATVGRAVGLCAWFGLSDLHFENIAFGLSKTGQLLWAPFDIEGAFADFTLLSQTLLLPAEGLSQGVPGLDSFLPWLLNSTDLTHRLAFCEAYVACMDFLNRHEQTIFDAIESAVDLATVPCRLIFRPTRDYAKVLQSSEHAKNLYPALCPAELCQLARGDIPYFFHFLNRPEIFIHDVADTVKVVTLPDQLTAKVLPSLTSIGERRPSRKKTILLQRAGVLQLARLFDPGDNGVIEAYNCKLVYEDSMIIYTTATGWTASARRQKSLRLQNPVSVDASRLVQAVY